MSKVTESREEGRAVLSVEWFFGHLRANHPILLRYLSLLLAEFDSIH